MSAHIAIASWIDPRHLTREVGLGYRAAFAAPAADRFFRYGFLTRARGELLERPDFATLLAVQQAFDAPATRAFFSAICGRPLGAVTTSARRMAPGDFLAEHTDDIGQRLISFVLYLTPAWAPGHGGELELDDGSGAYAHRVAPRFNHLALFDARAWHRVAPLAEAPPAPARVTLGGWYLDPAAPSPGATPS